MMTQFTDACLSPNLNELKYEIIGMIEWSFQFMLDYKSCDDYFFFSQLWYEYYMTKYLINLIWDRTNNSTTWILMDIDALAQGKAVVTPLLMHRRYYSLTLSRQY